MGAVVSLHVESYAGQAIQELDLFHTYGTQWVTQCRALAAFHPRKVQNTLYILIYNARQTDIQPHLARRCARWTQVGLSPHLVPGFLDTCKNIPQSFPVRGKWIYLRMICNGWFFARRMQTREPCVFCKLLCTLDCREHMFHCPAVRQALGRHFANLTVDHFSWLGLPNGSSWACFASSFHCILGGTHFVTPKL